MKKRLDDRRTEMVVGNGGLEHSTREEEIWLRASSLANEAAYIQRRGKV